MSAKTPVLLRNFLQEFDSADDLKKSELQPCSKSAPWLVSATIDYMFVCGFAPWILGFFAFFIFAPLNLQSSAPTQFALSVVFIVLSFLIGESHQFTSILRYITNTVKELPLKPAATKFSFWRAYLLLQVGGLLVLLVDPMMLNSVQFPINLIFLPLNSASQIFVAAVAPLALVLFPVALMHHICAQARGIGFIYCGKSGFRLSKTENLLLSSTMLLMVLLAAATIARPFGPMSHSLKTLNELLPPQAILPFCGTFVVATSLIFIMRGYLKGEWLPKQAACLWLNLSLFVLLGTLPSMIYVWLFVPLAFHATQHWAVAWDTHKKEQANSAECSKRMQVAQLIVPVLALTFFVLFLPALLPNGSALFAAKQPLQLLSATEAVARSPRLQETLPLQLSLLVFYLHYLADRVVWKGTKRRTPAHVKSN